MIEAVNSVLASAPLLRGNAEQASVARAALEAAERSQVQPSSPQAPFISPYISVDTNFDTAVLQIRDSDTGDVVRQFPSESALEARQRAEAVRTARREALPQSSGQRQTQSVQSNEGNFEVQDTASNSGRSEGISSPSAGGSGEAQRAAQALASSASVGQVNTGIVSVTA